MNCVENTTSAKTQRGHVKIKKAANEAKKMHLEEASTSKAPSTLLSKTSEDVLSSGLESRSSSLDSLKVRKVERPCRF